MAAILILILPSACTADSGPASTSVPPSTAGSAIDELPELARVSTGGGEPRSGAYWISWSTCGTNSQADVAAAGGGPDAGLYLVDDFLETPGIAVGDYVLGTCEAAIDLLSVRDNAGESRSESAAYELGSQLLTAELNLNSGGESCPALDQALVAAHVLLARAAFNGTGSYSEAWDEPASLAAEDLVVLLAAYNAGALCR